MRNKLIAGLVMACQLYFLVGVISAEAASPLFVEHSNTNLWIVDKNTGQMSAYRHRNGVNFWLESFDDTVYTLGSNEVALINNMTNSSDTLSSDLAPISLAGLGEADLDTAGNNGMLALTVTPESGSYNETIMVEMAVNVNLTNEGPVTLNWTINGDSSGNSTGSSTLVPASELHDGRLYTRFYLVLDDHYSITVKLLNTALNEIASKTVTYDLTSTDPNGKRRDTDSDGLPDLVELEIGLDPLTGDWKTDSDNNGWSDFDEWLRSANLGSDGLPLDSDNDGWSDFDEDLRGTEKNDQVQTLVGSSAPAADTEQYRNTLRLFQDIPAADRLYEVEYLIDVTATEIQADTQWRHFSSYIPGSEIIFDSDELLTIDDMDMAGSNKASIPPRRTLQLFATLITNDTFSHLRLPASHSQVLDILGINEQTINVGQPDESEQTRNWHFLHWLETQADLTPLNYDAGNSWTTVDEWKTAYIAYLGNNLVVSKSLQMNLTNTTNTSLLLNVLANEYALAGGLDLPVFNSRHGISQQIFDQLKQSLAIRENGRTLDDVYADLLTLGTSNVPFGNSRAVVQSGIQNMPWQQDSLHYLLEILSDDSEDMKLLAHISRLALFADGIAELDTDSTLGLIFSDSDADTIKNNTEILTTVFSQSLYPWLDDSDGDLVLDAVDPCPLDELNSCQLETPVLSISGPGNYNVTIIRGEGDYIVVTAQLNQATEQDVTVDFDLATLSGDSAVSGVDYEAMSGTLSIPAGEISASIIINILPKDNIGTENFHLILSNPQNATLGQTEYAINVETEPGDNPNLQSLLISAGSLDPVFSTYTQLYHVRVNASDATIKLTPTAEDANATITVNGIAVASGTESQAIALRAGSEDDITVIVTAESGQLMRIYTVSVIRPVPISDNADLGNLSLSSGLLSPGFDSATLNYTAAVGFGTTSIALTPTADNINAQITVNGNITVSGNASNSIALSEGDNIIEVVMLAEDGVTTQTYQVTITRATATQFVQEAYIKSASPDANDFFGVGDFSTGSNGGHTAKGLAMSGNTLAIAVSGEDSSSSWSTTNNNSAEAGAVYIFTRNINDNWSQQAYIKPDIKGAGDRFGSSLDLDGDTLVVGAIEEDSNSAGPGNNSSTNSGAAYVFTRTGTSWSQQAFLKASNSDAYDEFGISVAVSGDTIAVGALEDSSAQGINGSQTDNGSVQSGAVYIFSREVDTWSQQAYIKSSDSSIKYWFGISVSLDGHTLAVGANQENGPSSGNGAAYIFTRSGFTWTEQAVIHASNAETSDEFGKSVSIDNDTLVVGAPGEDSNSTEIDTGLDDNSASGAGAAYVFTRDSAGIWAQQAYLKESAPGLAYNFGNSVSVSRNAIVVGANVYLRNDASWSHFATYQPANPDVLDLFAANVALFDETIIAGSRQEDSNASGINGDETDNSLSSSGAAYAFRMPSDSNTTLHNNANLNDLLLSNGTLSAEFDSATLTYTASVGYTTTAISLIPSLADKDATVTVNGDSVTSNKSTDPISLDEGQNEISITVLAEDMSTSQTYLVTVTRLSASEFAQQVYLKASNTELGDSFGFSAAISGDTLVVGAPYEDSLVFGSSVQFHVTDEHDNSELNSGAAYVFVRDSDGAWSQQAYLKSANSNAGDYFGYSVDISGDTLVVGAYGEDNAYTGINPTSENYGSASSQNSGAAYVFLRDGEGIWTQQAYIKAKGSTKKAAGDYFGYNVTLSGDTLAVSLHNEDSYSLGDNHGAVEIYERTGSTWAFSTTLNSSNAEAGDTFGYAIDLSNDTLVVSARHEDSNATGVNADESNNDMAASGAVYVFVKTTGVWSQQAYIKASNTDIADIFGSSVAISGDILVVGAAYEESSSTGINQDESDNSLGSGAGAVYVFERNTEVWVQQAYIKASNTNEYDQFGSKVAVSGETIAVSARRERSSATGIGGIQTDNSADYAGATYIYKRDLDNNWSQSAYIKASNTEQEDYFGSGIALGADTLIVGANGEASNTVGINGSQQNGSGTNSSGAGYIFYIP